MMSSPRTYPPSSSARQSSPAADHRPQAARQPPRRFESLALDRNDDEDDGRAGEQAEDAEMAARRRAGRRIRGMPDDIERVRDFTGEAVMNSFQQFLETYTEEVAFPSTPASEPPQATAEEKLYYIEQIKALKDFELTTLYVRFDHLLEREEVLARAISNQYYRFLPYLRRALTNLIRKYSPNYLYLTPHNPGSSTTGLLTREFSLAFHSLPLTSGIRELRTAKIGTLMSISGTVTRTSEVRPELIFGAFVCEVCRTTVSDVEQQFKYTEPIMCQNPTCSNKSFWTLNIEQSKFSDWQKVRIQENSDEIPTGSMPRSLDVILRSEIVERAKAGDKCTFTGTFVVVPDVAQMSMPGGGAELQKEGRGGGRGEAGVASQGVTGLKELGVRDLGYKTAFLACMAENSDTRAAATNVRGDGQDEDDDQQAFLSSLTKEEVEELRAMVNTEHIYARLVGSIAPTVYGHEIVKKGILLQLMGGVHKQTPEGIHLRGDINICIVGDPSTSKSQFLKYVCGFLPRAVYTSGKASSAAGLTAAVVKDEETGEFTIEAGALMLADNGICAIDEFDKMDVADQVAIHEAMEQQTISIAKAGIQATLNARTSILAAANPVGGRYNRKMSLRANVAMSAPIMSRFDLFFVVLDECNEDVDLHIAQHIVNVHRFRDAAINPEYSTEALQRYIRFARTYKPKLTPDASAVLVEKYRQLRQEDAGGAGKNSYRITVRQLESMIRLSEAIARANCQSDITPPMVREAFALLRQSIIHVEKDDIDFDDDDDLPTDGMDVDNAERIAAEIAAAEEAEAAYAAASGAVPPTSSSSARGRTAGPSSVPPPLQSAPAKKKLKITYDRYMSIMNLVVMHLAEAERTDTPGVYQEELIEWYLEQREADLQTVQDLEDERDLIVKALNKLVKDQYLLEIRGVVRDSLQSTDEGGAQQVEEVDENKISYMIHPQVDLSDLSSSIG